MALIISLVICIVLFLWAMKMLLKIDSFYINSFGIWLWEYFPVMVVMGCSLLAASVAISEVQKYF